MRTAIEHGESYSYGYCNVGDIPEFILVGEMGNEIELSGTIPAWESNGIFMIGTLTESVEFPDQITLEPAYPNPFNPITTIEYGLSKNTYINISIYNISGCKIIQLEESFKYTGHHIIQWDAHNYSTGIYFITLTTNEYKKTQKLMLIK